MTGQGLDSGLRGNDREKAGMTGKGVDNRGKAEK
jgi:hypothetical protein